MVEAQTEWVTHTLQDHSLEYRTSSGQKGFSTRLMVHWSVEGES